jgi:hypothetical protein
MSWVDHRHPDYLKLYERWDFLLEAYEGGQEYIKADWTLYRDEKPEANFIRHLHQHERENMDDYRDRLTRAYYLNFTKPIIHIYRDHIIRKGIETVFADDKSKDDVWLEFEKDCTKTGMSLDYFMMKRVFPMVQVFGWMPLLVDMEFYPEGIRTEKERKEKDARPFVVRIYPKDFLNWQVGPDGKFDWVYFRESNVQSWDDPENITSMNIEETFKVITRDSWAVYDSHGDIVKDKDNEELKGNHNLKEVPIVIAFNEETEQYSHPIGMSAVNDIADINKELYNLSSLEQEFLYRQCFAVLLMDEKFLGKIMALGVGNALPTAEGQVPPEYISPSIDPAKYISDKQKDLIAEMYRHAVVRDTTATAAAESGISKAYDFHHSNQNIASKSKSMEEAEAQLKYYHYLWLEGGNIDKAKDRADKITRRYPQEFDVKTINEEIEEVIRILKEDLGSRTLNQSLVKNNIVKRMFKDEKMRSRIFAEIEKVDPGLNHEERMKRVEMNIMNIVDEIMIQDPDLSEDQALEKMEENIKINKISLQSKMVNTDPVGGDQRQKIRDQLSKKGIKVKDEGS